MKKKNSRKGRKNVIQQQKDRLRGLIGEARGFVSYQERKENKKDVFDNKFNKALFNAREVLPPDSKDNYMAWVEKMLHDLLPNKTEIARPSWRTISFINESKVISYKAEVTWLIARLRKENLKISAFIKIKDDIELGFLNGDFERIIDDLDFLDKKYGCSLWSLETRIGATQFFKGLEAQKKLYNEIKGLAGVGFIRFIAYRISMRNEPAVSLSRFKQATVTLKENYNHIKDLPEFITYKLSGELPRDLETSLSILRFSQNLSVIDCYESFVNIAQSLFINDSDSDLFKFLAGEMTAESFDDFRWSRILDEGGVKRNYNKSICTSEGFFSGKGFCSVYNIMKDIRCGQGSAFDIILLAIIKNEKASDRFSTNNKSAKLINSLTKINSKGSDFIPALQYLEKEILNLATLPFFKSLLEGISIIKNIEIPTLKMSLKKLALNNRSNHFLNSILYESEVNGVLLDINGREFPNVELMLNSIQRNKGEGGDEYFQPNKTLVLYCLIVESFNVHSYPVCLKYIDDLKKIDGHKGLWNKISSIETISLLETGNVEKSISLMARNICDENYPNEIIETGGIIKQKTTWPQIRKYAADISLIILLDYLCEVTASDSIATLRRTAIDNYLKIHGVQKPSEIVNIYDLRSKTEKEKLIYFYNNVCNPQVLEMCRCLNSGTNAVEEERAAILSVLIQLDVEKSDLYQGEILSITSDLRIREGLKVVDESRLYVNQEGLLRWAKVEQSEDILRYKNLVDAGIGCGEDLSELLLSLENSSDTNKKLLKVPENEADELLYQLFCELKDAFLFENEHGLNSYLSKRIRHNSIAGFLRGAVESENLITLKDSRGIYIENSFWKERFEGFYSENIIEKSLKELTAFGESFDSKIHYIRNELIQIKSNNKPDGGIFIDQEQMVILFHIVRGFIKKNDFEIASWVEVATSLFWHMLEPSLSELRMLLSSGYKSIFQGYFDNLKHNLVKHAGMEISGHEIFNAIHNASLELNILLDRASEWLKKGQSELSKITYSINEIIDIAVRAALVRHKGCNLSVKKYIDNSINLRADALVALSDIILIVIGNISEHSGLRECAELKVIASFSVDRSRLNFKFNSKVSRGKNNSENNANLAIIRNKIESGDYLSNIAIEGKSGIIKIASIVQPHTNGSIDFGFEGDECFYINIEMAYAGKSDMPYQMLEVTDEYFTN